jgi:plastocyanin
LSSKAVLLPITAAIAAATIAVPFAPASNRVPTAVAAQAHIAIKDNFFSPRSLTVKRGTMVVWVWRGENSHSLTFVRVPKGASRRGADVRRRGRWRRTFRRPGFYKYVCLQHAGQEGSIYVK